jgi:hypothetical protein
VYIPPPLHRTFVPLFHYPWFFSSPFLYLSSYLTYFALPSSISLLSPIFYSRKFLMSSVFSLFSPILSPFTSLFYPINLSFSSFSFASVYSPNLSPPRKTNLFFLSSLSSTISSFLGAPFPTFLSTLTTFLHAFYLFSLPPSTADTDSFLVASVGANGSRNLLHSICFSGVSFPSFVSDHPLYFISSLLVPMHLGKFLGSMQYTILYVRC